MERHKYDHKRVEVNHLRLAAILAINYKTAYGKYPDVLTDATDNDPDFNLDDEWGTDVIYRRDEFDFKVVSAGPDKHFDTDDDITFEPSDFDQ
ncbi:hypothetical protein OAG71_00590 [bacterium]|nr:hypothetical protein [bacterium]